jgi:hypothetical protein
MAKIGALLATWSLRSIYLWSFFPDALLASRSLGYRVHIIGKKLGKNRCLTCHMVFTVHIFMKFFPDALLASRSLGSLPSSLFLSFFYLATMFPSSPCPPVSFPITGFTYWHIALFSCLSFHCLSVYMFWFLVREENDLKTIFWFCICLCFATFYFMYIRVCDTFSKISLLENVWIMFLIFYISCYLYII